MKIRRNWRALLEEVVLSKGGNRAALSRGSGLNATYLRDVIEKGQTPSLPSAQKLSEGLGLEITDWFLQAEPAKRREIPVIDYVRAGAWTPVTDPYALGQGFATVIADSDVHPSAFALEITGDSMISRFHDGDRIIIDPELEPTPGDFVVAKLKADDQATFKQYRPRGRDSRGRTIIELRPLNDVYPALMIDPKNPGHIVGTMIEHHSYRRSGR